MSSCLPKYTEPLALLLHKTYVECRSKHVKLTQACYPKSKTASAKPNSSELQYLAYYASSRPKKLIKVGAFIRQKTAKDVYWSRQTDVIVSLEICATLVEKCHANLNLFAEDVLAVIQSATTIGDLTITQSSGQCFATFCKYHDGSALGTDSKFTLAYLRLLETFSNFATISNNSEQDDFRLTGLEAIASACSSPAMQVSKNESQIVTMMPVLLVNLTSIKEALLYNLKQQLDKYDGNWVSKRHSAVAGAIPDSNHDTDTRTQLVQEDIAMCSLATLKILFETNDAVQIRDSTNSMLHYFEGKNVRAEWSSTLLQIVAEWAPINLRFHILRSCLQQLEISEVLDWPTNLQNNLLCVIQGLLTSRINMIGLSTTDVLDSLLNTASRLLRQSDSRQLDYIGQYFATSGISAEIGRSAVVFLNGIIDAVVDITAHSYYKAQISDMFDVIMSRLSVSFAEADVLSCTSKLLYMEMAIRLLKQSDVKKDNESRSFVAIGSFDQYFRLLYSNIAIIRTKFSELFCTYLSVECARMAKTMSLLRPDSSTAQQLNSALYHHVQDTTGANLDLSIAASVVKSLCATLPGTESIFLLPLLDQLQQKFLPSDGSNIACPVVLVQFLRVSLADIVVACGDAGYAAEIMDTSDTQDRNMPKASDVLTHLLQGKAADISNEERLVLESPWSPDLITTQSPRTLSLRQLHKSRKASSADASRRPPDIAATRGVSQPSVSVGIEDLKTNLNRPRRENIRSTGEALDLDELFEGLELQQMPRPQSGSNHAVDVTESAPKNRPIESMVSVPSLSLGRIVA